MSSTNLGRVQGAGFFYSTASVASSDTSASILLSTITPTNITPLIGDCIMFSNGDARKVTNINLSATTPYVTCGNVVASFAGSGAAGSEPATTGKSLRYIVANDYANIEASYCYDSQTLFDAIGTTMTFYDVSFDTDCQIGDNAIIPYFNTDNAYIRLLGGEIVSVDYTNSEATVTLKWYTN